MDPEGFPDFGPILEEACKEQLKEVLPENLLEPLQKGFSELFRLCQTPEDELILKKCFRVVRRVGIPLVKGCQCWMEVRCLKINGKNQCPVYLSTKH